ncbi:MAG: DinB family protein [Ktedonobacteraceae bacterium]
MPHPLVLQLRFTRSEFQRALAGVTDAEARRRFMPMNCISWNIGHLAWQEQAFWVWFGPGKLLLPHLNDLFATGAPACTPALDEVLEAWHTVTQSADPWLDTLTTEKMQAYALDEGEPTELTFGSLLLRITYHYWHHLGENMAMRQLLGHTDVPEFVGNIDDEAPYRPE